jgi:hypothetical protein
MRRQEDKGFRMRPVMSILMIMRMRIISPGCHENVTNDDNYIRDNK